MLGLELTDPGFDYSVLSAFRQRLVENQKAQALLDMLLSEATQRGWLKLRGQRRAFRGLPVWRPILRLFRPAGTPADFANSIKSHYTTRQSCV